MVRGVHGPWQIAVAVAALAIMGIVLRKARSAVVLVRNKVERAREVRQKAPLYAAPHHNLDPETHIREAAGWLCRAQDYGTDRGFSYGADFGQGFLPSYPETTGYIIRTFLDLALHYGDSSYQTRAAEAGAWELSVQMACGAAGMYLGKQEPAIFDTGMVLLGWAALCRAGYTGQFGPAARRAGEWLVQEQESNGSWIRGNAHGFANPTATTYNVKAAWGLAEAGAALGEQRFIDAALRNARYTLTRQTTNGWFEDCCLSDPARPLLHTIAYAAQGLLGIGKVAGRREFIEGAARTAGSLIRLMDAEGFIPGRFDRHFQGRVNWCCLTGTAQISMVWSELASITGDQRYIEAAQRANRYLMARHDISSPDPSIRGGLPGSWPVWGDYGRLKILNWATKFFVDALLARLPGR